MPAKVAIVATAASTIRFSAAIPTVEVCRAAHALLLLHPAVRSPNLLHSKLACLVVHAVTFRDVECRYHVVLCCRAAHTV